MGRVGTSIGILWTAKTAGYATFPCIMGSTSSLEILKNIAESSLREVNPKSVPVSRFPDFDKREALCTIIYSGLR
jgi:hypothetical protein